MKPTDYVVFIGWSDEDECFVATVPDLPGCMADGETDAEALKNARSAIRSWIEVATELGRKIPVPRHFSKLEAGALQKRSLKRSSPKLSQK